MSPDDPNADTEPGPDLNIKRRLGLMRGRPPSRLNAPDLDSGCEVIPTRAVPLHQDVDDANLRLLDEDGFCVNNARTFNCEGRMAAAPPLRRAADVDERTTDVDEHDADPAALTDLTTSPRLTVVPNDAEKQAQALRCIELMLGQLIDHAYTDNLNALHSAEVERDAVMGSLPQRVFTVKVGSHTLITDHPNVMRLLAPWLEVHRTVAADLPECAYRVNVALTLTPAHRPG